MDLDGSGITPTRAAHAQRDRARRRIPQTGTLWAGVAGQDELPHGHPYEIFDAVTLHEGVADYGWPHCYENRKPVDGHDCSGRRRAARRDSRPTKRRSAPRSIRRHEAARTRFPQPIAAARS